ncbi:unnamed protein product [Brachionus calyciflorus]|uniref:DRBM domain-containing protein n=1 Tax=Brachionus calyciflorus TaxID=104777 RepID=A0A813ZQ25_9BILA|nr:unnamed protein product [Brachionus calyciflorus]
MSEETSVSKKRTLESDSDLSQDSSKRLKISNESYVKSHNYKNSIQYIHEIPNIQPIKFEMLAQEGQAHKPVFKFCLNINIEGQAVAFYSSGASKKQAKIIAALKAISHLIDLPSFFHPDEIEAYKYLISVESKVNNIDKSALEKFESSSFDVSVPVAETKICEIKSVNPVKNEAILKEITTESSKLEFDLKTKEIISTRNSLTILNHLLPKKLYTENLVEESGQAHSKIFKFEIRVIRDELKQSKIQFYLDLENESSKIKDSPLFKNLGDEFIFYGIGSTKKIAKSRAAQHLLEVLFNIKLSNPGK